MSTPPVREQFLVISALGANPMELTSTLCKASQENGVSVPSLWFRFDSVSFCLWFGEFFKKIFLASILRFSLTVLRV